MKSIGRLGVWMFPDALSVREIAELARDAERLEYDALWYPEGVGYETFGFGGFILSETDRLIVASGIANIYARDAVTAMAGHDTLNKLYGDRFVLGLGVSHIPLVEGFRGHSYGKPVATMRAYLDAMEAAQFSFSVAERNVVLAALGPNMLALARDRSKGAHPYLVTPEHTARAREILGPDAWLCVEQKVCLTSDTTQARDIAASVLELYLMLPNYRNNWLSLGFGEEELSGRGSDRFLDAMVASGNAAEICARLRAHFDAGADHVCVQPLNPDGSGSVDWNALEAAAEV
ncbi:MAG: TIGR03620 family F420-dependent LLM class oxidoreductase [Alphaproteobacteria bacterium]|nr:TIGR03620 family F420-dependent LLM class oxidoreductase [Alphaproteobacteria bacterium]MDP6591052.1 TIGR03620 family F420-dependent LLM class oxidoreductase [Alphaproteobacteria bacterium]